MCGLEAVPREGALDGTRPLVIALVGEPGVGKTALARRFALGESPDQLGVSCGHTMEYHATLPWRSMEELGFGDEEASWCCCLPPLCSCYCCQSCCGCTEPRELQVTIRDIHGRYDGQTNLDEYRGVDCFLFCFNLRDGDTLGELRPHYIPWEPRGVLALRQQLRDDGLLRRATTLLVGLQK